MKLAVVGVGHWGPNLVRNLVGLREVEGLVVCDTDPARLAAVAGRFGRLEPTTDLDRVLADREVAAVLLATPISTHAALGRRVLEADKHLFVEKPLADDVAAAEGLVDLAARRGKLLMVGHTFEYSPPVVKIGELLAAGELGRILFVSTTRVNLGIHRPDASVIWDLAPHDTSILMRWLGEAPVRVHAVARACVQPGVPDVAFLQFWFESGVIANLEFAWLAPSKLRQTTIVGERKMLVYDDTENIEKVKLYDQGVDFREPADFGEFQLSYRSGDIVSPRIASDEPLALEMAHLVECLRTGRTPRTDGRAGLEVVRVLAAAHRSLALGRPVEVSR